MSDQNPFAPDLQTAERRLHPRAQLLADNAQYRFYHGRSMRSIFQPGDLLRLETVRLEDLHPGDVIVFKGQAEPHHQDDVVHRVVALYPEGAATRGDNNPWMDPGLVSEQNLVGRVTTFERGGRQFPIPPRQPLSQWGRTRRIAAWWLQHSLFWLARPPYRLLRYSGWAALIWRPRLTRLRLNDPGGQLIKYLHGRTTVAAWRAQGEVWYRPPYDLVLARLFPDAWAVEWRRLRPLSTPPAGSEQNTL